MSKVIEAPAPGASATVTMTLAVDFVSPVTRMDDEPGVPVIAETVAVAKYDVSGCAAAKVKVPVVTVLGIVACPAVPDFETAVLAFVNAELAVVFASAASV